MLTWLKRSYLDVVLLFLLVPVDAVRNVSFQRFCWMDTVTVVTLFLRRWFLRSLPAEMAISSAPVLLVEKSQVSRRSWDTGMNDILSNYLSPPHRLVRGPKEAAWDEQLRRKRFWSGPRLLLPSSNQLENCRRQRTNLCSEKNHARSS